jgi:acyl-CoA oxidase
MAEMTVPDPLAPLTADVVERLQAHLDGPHAVVRAQTREALCGLGLEKAEGLDREAYRDQVLEWLRALAGGGAGARSFPPELGGADDPAGSIASFQTLAHGDLSLLVKVGVQFGLFGGAVHRLGTEVHHRTYLPKAASVDLPGCFAMSESGHGSDVRSIRTQARYDAAAQEFVSTRRTTTRARTGSATPPGTAASPPSSRSSTSPARPAGCTPSWYRCATATATCSRASRSRTAATRWGCRAWTTGGSASPPYGCRARRCSTATARSPRRRVHLQHQQPGRRFFTMIGALVQGRICIGSAGLAVARNALTIAVRWGERRRQFGTGLDMDTPLMDYLTTSGACCRRSPSRTRCRPPSTTSPRSTSRSARAGGERQREVEALAAGLKAVGTWHMVRTVQDAASAAAARAT